MPLSGVEGFGASEIVDPSLFVVSEGGEKGLCRAGDAGRRKNRECRGSAQGLWCGRKRWRRWRRRLWAFRTTPGSISSSVTRPGSWT